MNSYSNKLIALLVLPIFPGKMCNGDSGNVSVVNYRGVEYTYSVDVSSDRKISIENFDSMAIGPGKAAQIASKALKEIYGIDHQRVLQSIQLKQACDDCDNWYYLVVFGPPAKGIVVGLHADLEVVVLPNGKLVAPRKKVIHSIPEVEK